MSGLTETVVFANCLGSASWSYLPSSKKASGQFFVNTYAENNSVPLNLEINHMFKSSRFSQEENKLIVDGLAVILYSIGAEQVTSETYYHYASQELRVFYIFKNIQQNKLDELTSLIASVCVEVVDQMAIGYTCDIKDDPNIPDLGNSTSGIDYTPGVTGPVQFKR